MGIAAEVGFPGFPCVGPSGRGGAQIRTTGQVMVRVMPSICWMSRTTMRPEVVHGGGLGAGDDVVGPGHALGHDDTLDGADLLGHLGRLADVGLDQDVRMDGHGTPYIGLVAMSPKIEQFKDMARQARQDLFDQSHPIGRLSLVQCAMLGGRHARHDLAGGFAVLLHLARTRRTTRSSSISSSPWRPSPSSRRCSGRSSTAAAGRGASWWCPRPSAGPCCARSWPSTSTACCLFPLAFLVLVCSKLYLVTKGALVPEMAALDGPDENGSRPATPRSTRG